MSTATGHVSRGSSGKVSKGSGVRDMMGVMPAAMTDTSLGTVSPRRRSAGNRDWATALAVLSTMPVMPGSFT